MTLIFSGCAISGWRQRLDRNVTSAAGSGKQQCVPFKPAQLVIESQRGIVLQHSRLLHGVLRFEIAHKLPGTASSVDKSGCTPAKFVSSCPPAALYNCTEV
jgi:hypothetical protein